MRDPAWSPDGKRLAVVILDRIWITSPDGRDGRELTRLSASEREPAWSSDGKRVAFVGDRGKGFDLYVADSRGGMPERVLELDGDERTPSWTPDGRIVFAHRAADDVQWDLFLVNPAGSGSSRVPLRLTQSPDDELQPRVSPDGRRIAFTSNRNSDDGDFDIWLMRLFDRTAPASSSGRGPAVRLARQPGYDGFPEWSPDGSRLAYYSVRDGVGATWVTDVNPLGESDSLSPGRPVSASVLVSRHGGTLTWSPDGRQLAIGEIPEPDAGYNGNPRRDLDDPPALFGERARLSAVDRAGPARGRRRGARTCGARHRSTAAPYKRAFDSVWTTLKRVYYQTGESSRAWDRLRAELEPRAEQARSESALEDVIDQMIARQPLVKPRVTSSRAVVVSAHPLASEAGRAVLARGGNVVDAAIAISFVLGVVEPDASGIGGDGQAVLFLNGMAEPAVIDFKDQTPGGATLDNPRHLPRCATGGRWPAGGQHPRRRRRNGLPALEVREWSNCLVRAACAGRGARRAGVRPRSDAAIEHRRGPAVLPEVRGCGAHLSPQWQSAEARRALRQSRLRGDASYHRGRRGRVVLSRFASAPNRRRHAGQRRPDHLRRPCAVSGDRTEAGEWTLSRARPLHRRAARERGRLAARSVPGPRHYKAAPGATPARDADYWHYLIESWKLRDRVARIADPAQWPVDFDEHLDAEHAASLFHRINPKLAQIFPEDSDESRRRPGTDRQRHERLRGRRYRRQRDRRHPDAQHLGRILLRVARARVPLQQPPALEPHRARLLRAVEAATHDPTPRTCRCSSSRRAAARSRLVWPWRRPATPGFLRRPTRS